MTIAISSVPHYEIKYLVKVTDDFIQELKTFESLIVDVVLGVEGRVVGDGSEHHRNVFIRFMVQVIVGVGGETRTKILLSHVNGQNVLHQNAVDLVHQFRLSTLSLQVLRPLKVKSKNVLNLSVDDVQ